MYNRLFFLVLIVAALVAGPAHSNPTDHDFHAITENEKKLFSPLVCNGAAPSDTGFEQTCNPALVGSPAADGPSLITFHSIAYGSFSAPRTDEALILFTGNIGGEGPNGFGAILFNHQNPRWGFSKALVESHFSECVVVPSHHQDKLLCLDHPMMCCGQSYRAVNLFTWPMEGIITKLLESHSGRMDPEYEGPFCEVGSKGAMMLTMISNLKRSKEPDVFAEADIEYLVPAEVNRLCQTRPFNAGFGGKKPDPQPKISKDHVRFVLNGDTVKVVLPAGIKAFSVY